MACQRTGWAGCPRCGGRYRVRHVCDEAAAARIAAARDRAVAGVEWTETHRDTLDRAVRDVRMSS